MGDLMRNLRNNKRNVLNHLERDLCGISDSTCPSQFECGTLFASHGWHFEDHYLYSIHFHHCGSAKQWYSVPALKAKQFEEAAEKYAPRVFEQTPDILCHSTTHVSPLWLRDQGVPVFKVRQEPGDFIVTFPQSYHCSFDTGFSIAESANFGTADWLCYGLKCVERYRSLLHLSRFFLQNHI